MRKEIVLFRTKTDSKINTIEYHPGGCAFPNTASGQEVNSGVAGAVASGVLVLLLLVVMITSIALFSWRKKCRHQKFNLSTNVAYHKRNAAADEPTQINDYEVVTEENIAYEQSPPHVSEVPELTCSGVYEDTKGSVNFTLDSVEEDEGKCHNTCTYYNVSPQTLSDLRSNAMTSSTENYDYIA